MTAQTQQFKALGLPLFKALGIPAMDPNCCCVEEDCCAGLNLTGDTTVHLSNFINCCTFNNGTYTLVPAHSFDICQWIYDQIFSIPSDPCGTGTNVACHTEVISATETYYYYPVQLTISASPAVGGVAVSVAMYFARYYHNSSTGECTADGTYGGGVRYHKTACGNGVVPAQNNNNDLGVVWGPHLTPCIKMENSVGTVEVEFPV